MFGMLVFLSILYTWLYFLPASAQAEGLTLKLNRDFGYGDFSGNIQGRFSLAVEDMPDLERVVFFIDGQLIAEDSEAPFKISFSTESYTLGEHTMSARGYTRAGIEIASNQVRRNFVTSEAGLETAGRIILPLLAVVFGGMLLSFAIPWALGRNKRVNLPYGASRSYGLLGGTVCPKCSRPFALHLYAMNLGFSKLDRCPYCGRWSLVRRAPFETLKAAEMAELAMAGTGRQTSEREAQEGLRKELDESKYQDL
jgi:hypothetical protein